MLNESLTSANLLIEPRRDGQLQWTNVEPTGWQRIGDFLAQIGSQLLGALQGLAEQALKGVAAAGQIFFTKLLEQAARIAGFNAEEFFTTVENVQKLFGKVLGDAGAIINSIAADPRKFFSNLLEGVDQGFRTFFDEHKFLSNIQEQLSDWLLGFVKDVPADLSLPDPLGSVEKWLQFGLRIIGLDWNGIKGLLKEAVPDRLKDEADSLLEAAEEFFFGESGMGEAIDENMLSKALEKITGFFSTDGPELRNELQNEGFKLVTGLVVEEGVKLLIRWLAPLITGPLGGIGKLLGLVYDGIKWLVNKGNLVVCIIQQVFGILKDVLGQNGPAKVATRFIEILKKSVQAVLTLVAQLLGLDSVPKKIGDLINKIREKVKEVIKKLFAKLFGQKIKPKPGAACPVKKKPNAGKAPPATARVGAPRVPKPNCGSCVVEDELVWTPEGPVPVQEVYGQHRVAVSMLPAQLAALAVPDAVLDPETTREVHLHAVKDSVLLREAKLLRDVAWLRQVNAQPGLTVWIDLPEMRFAGWAEVVAVKACPRLPGGAGRQVTGFFKHYFGEAYDLRLVGVESAIGITATHPVWSLDRQDWVAAGELLIGERVVGDNGALVVESLTRRAGTEPVFNIEVDGDHCYRVGQQGLLVHNASVFKQVPIKKDGDGFGHAQKGQRARTVLSVGRDNRQALLQGWYNFGSLTYRTQCDPETGELATGGKEETIPATAIGVGLIRSDNREGHVEEKLIALLENAVSTSASSGCVCIVQVFTERSPCKGDDSCTTLLNSDRVKKLHNTKARFMVYYVGKWVADDDMSGERLVKAYGRIGLPINENIK